MNMNPTPTKPGCLTGTERYSCPHCTRSLSGLTLLSEQERSVVENALRVAADKFGWDARDAWSTEQTLHAKRMEKQAQECRDLLKELE